MINFLSSWIKNLSLALIIISILEMLIPNNNTKKYVKMIMGIYILFSIIYPFVSNSKKVDFNNINFSELVEEKSISAASKEKVNQINMDDRLNKLYKENLERDIKEKINNKGYVVKECNVYCHIKGKDSGIDKIILKIDSKKEINDEINKDSLENKLVSEIQKVQKIEIKNSEKEIFKITKTDINIIKKFLVDEYGVKEECLKIS